MNVQEALTIVRLASVMSLYTLIHDVFPSVNLSSGPGAVPLTNTVDFSGRHDCDMFFAVTRSMASGINDSSWVHDVGGGFPGVTAIENKSSAVARTALKDCNISKIKSYKNI
jgi:hypothetical protein